MTDVLLLQTCNKLAEKHGGKCLSKQYINDQIHLLWQCAVGHVFHSSLSSIDETYFCHICHINKALKKCKEFAEKHGGKCLTTEFVNVKTPLTWQCAMGHVWRKQWSKMNNSKTFCNVCKKLQNKKDLLKKCHEFAENRGGKCLSTVYVNSYTSLKWECAVGHIYRKSLVSARLIFCLKCYREINRKMKLKLSILDSQQPKKQPKNPTQQPSRDCYSPPVIKHPPIQPIVIPNKPVRKSTSTLITNEPLSLAECQDIAFINGGICLSKQYINSQYGMEWECAAGHLLYETAENVCRKRKWCDTCEDIDEEN